MTASQVQSDYHQLIEHAIAQPDSLPMLPMWVFDFKKAIIESRTNNDTLAKVIASKPEFEHLLRRAVRTPAYTTSNKHESLSDVIGLIGMSNCHNLIMLQSIKDLFQVQQPHLQALFDISWQRQIGKTCFSKFFAYKLGYEPVDDATLASLLTEAGSIAILSLLDKSDLPALGLDDYLDLCRQYSKPLITIMAEQWQVEEHISLAVQHTGKWHTSLQANLDLLDVLNIALYHTIQLTKRTPDLPALTDMPAYRKLSPELQVLSNNQQQLKLINEHYHEIKAIRQSFS